MADWLGGWKYRRSHTINPAAGAGTNYPIRIKVHKNFTDPFAKYSGNPVMRQLHPDVHYFPEGRDGYKYWMSYTPYPPESNEHPCIRRSNDGINWVDDGITNPVINHGAYAYDSDPDMIYVVDYNKWFMVWGARTGSAWVLALAYSSDGKTWTEYDGVAINGNTDPVILSGSDTGGEDWERLGAQSRVQYPTLYYAAGVFYLFYGVNTAVNQGPVGYATFTWNNVTNDIENFARHVGNPVVSLSADAIYEAGCGHLDISKYDGTYYMYCIRKRLGVDVYDVMQLTSTDMNTWTNNGLVIETGPVGQWDDKYAYRTCPVVDGEGNRVLINGRERLYYSAMNANLVSGIGIAQSGDLFEDQVSLDGHCESDFSDIRITSDDGQTLLDYWIEYKADNDFAFIWVKIPGDLSTVAKTIYLYYGKSGAVTTSDILNTFLKAADGVGGNLDELQVGSSVFSHASGKYKNTGGALVTDGWASGNVIADWNKFIRANGNIVPVGTGIMEWALYDVESIKQIFGLNNSDYNWSSVCYGNGIFVAVTETGKVMTSTEGKYWMPRLSATDLAWKSVCYGNGLFVAVASSGTGNRVMTSPDGINWTSQASPADINWTSVCYGNGLFVAVASSGTGNRVMTSPDGINWTSQASAADITWGGVTYGNGLFVAVGASGTSSNSVMTSPDGITWTSQSMPGFNEFRNVCFGNGLFVAVGYYGAYRVMTSPDGINWTFQTAAAANSWRGVCYWDGLYVATAITGTGNRIMTSPDGINWTSQASPADINWTSVCYGNGLFVAVASSGVGNRVMTSPDGITWTPRISGYVINLFRFGITRSGINISIKYMDTSGVLQYWNGYGWQSAVRNFQLNTSDALSFQIWSDGINLYADVLNNGISILTNTYFHDLVSIPIASIKPFTLGKCFAWTERLFDSYFLTNEVDNVFVRSYVDPEPLSGSWGAEESGSGSGFVPKMIMIM